MDDDNRLDLTLSLPCGGLSTGIKGTDGTGSEVRVEETDRGSKLIDDFKNFLDGANHKEESIVSSHRGNPSKPEENLFYDLSKGATNVDASNVNSGGFWVKNEPRSTEILDDRRQEAGSKRKNMFDEINHQKRQEREAYLAGMHGKTRTPHVSIATDEGSTAENEDVADSEAEGSTSKLVQQRDDASKRHPGSVGLSESTKEVRVVSDPSGIDLQGQRRFTISSEKDFNVGHVSHGVPLSGQSANILNMPYPLSLKESNSNAMSANVPSGYILPGTIPVMASTSNDRPGNQQPVIPANLPMMFGYTSVQIPTAEGVNAFERAKAAKEEGASMPTEGDAKGIEQARSDGIPPEYPAIRPGIAADVKFGGSGSSPNLPWVSTAGTGPNGKTISGVTYRYTGNQIRIVCACHGSHMSPEEFVQHANEQPPNPSALPSYPNTNPAASAQN